jgi:hypothetical protein
MAAIIKFIYTMFLFIFLFVVPTKVDGKKINLPFNCLSLRCFLYTIFFSCFNKSNLFFFFIIAFAGCVTDADCVIKKCSSSCRIKCIDFQCLCPTGF